MEAKFISSNFTMNKINCRVFHVMIDDLLSSYLPSSPEVFVVLVSFLSMFLCLVLIVFNNMAISLSPQEFADYGREKKEEGAATTTEEEEYLSKEHLEAIALRRWKTVLSWIAFHPNQVSSQKDRKGQTILHHAALFRAPAHIMDMILWASPELAAKSNRDGELALHWAVRLSTPNPVLNLLLQANPEAAFCRDRVEGVTPLSLLWERHQSSLINIWRSDGNQLLTESENTWRRILFIFRAIHNEKEQKQQKTKKSNANDQSSIATFQPLHIAVSRPLPPGLLPLMLAVYKDELYEKDQNEELPLMIACKCPMANRYCDVLTKIQLLLREFPDAAKSKAVCGRYPLHEALASGILWNDGIESLIQSFPPALSTCDPVSGLFPFALAACEKSSKENSYTYNNDETAASEMTENNGHDSGFLTTIYSLLREDPSVLRVA